MIGSTVVDHTVEYMRNEYLIHQILPEIFSPSISFNSEFNENRMDTGQYVSFENVNESFPVFKYDYSDYGSYKVVTEGTRNKSENESGRNEELSMGFLYAFAERK
ncbi:hypothetical protein AYI70_g9379, partial [Smittium culicis]